MRYTRRVPGTWWALCECRHQIMQHALQSGPPSWVPSVTSPAPLTSGASSTEILAILYPCPTLIFLAYNRTCCFSAWNDLDSLLFLVNSLIILQDWAPVLSLSLQSPSGWAGHPSAVHFCDVAECILIACLRCCTPPPGKLPKVREHARFSVVSPGPSPVWPVINPQ